MATIYDLNGYTITDGLQSKTVCDAAMWTAKRIAKERNQTVILDDNGDERLVGPRGRVRNFTRIARKHGAQLVNYTDERCNCGYGCRPGTCKQSRRHWFAGPNYGSPFNENMARAVKADLEKAGLVERVQSGD